MLTPKRRMPHVHPHVPDLAQSMPLDLPARVGVAVEVLLRLNDKSTWRPDDFLSFVLSVLESHGCLCGRMLAVLGTFISLFIGFFDPLVLFPCCSLLL
jgi:hypothetical protein